MVSESERARRGPWPGAAYSTRTAHVHCHHCKRRGSNNTFLQKSRHQPHSPLSLIEATLAFTQAACPHWPDSPAPRPPFRRPNSLFAECPPPPTTPPNPLSNPPIPIFTDEASMKLPQIGPQRTTHSMIVQSSVACAPPPPPLLRRRQYAARLGATMRDVPLPFPAVVTLPSLCRARPQYVATPRSASYMVWNCARKSDATAHSACQAAPRLAPHQCAGRTAHVAQRCKRPPLVLSPHTPPPSTPRRTARMLLSHAAAVVARGSGSTRGSVEHARGVCAGMQHLDVLEQVEDAELLLANGGEGGVAKLQGALALTVHGPQVVELLRTACTWRHLPATAGGRARGDCAPPHTGAILRVCAPAPTLPRPARTHAAQARGAPRAGVRSAMRHVAPRCSAGPAAQTAQAARRVCRHRGTPPHRPP